MKQKPLNALLYLATVACSFVLPSLGYATAHIGKWHLGGGEFLPEHQGFDTNIAGGKTGHPASYFWPYGGQRHSLSAKLPAGASDVGRAGLPGRARRQAG